MAENVDRLYHCRFSTVLGEIASGEDDSDPATSNPVGHPASLLHATGSNEYLHIFDFVSAHAAAVAAKNKEENTQHRQRKTEWKSARHDTENRGPRRGCEICTVSAQEQKRRGRDEAHDYNTSTTTNMAASYGRTITSGFGFRYFYPDLFRAVYPQWFLREGREGRLIVDVDVGRRAVGTGRPSATSTTPTAASVASVASVATTPAITAASASTTAGAFKARLDLEEDLFFLLGARLGRGLGLQGRMEKHRLIISSHPIHLSGGAHLANEVGVFLLVLLFLGDGVFPEIIAGTLVSLPDTFKLGDGGIGGLLLLGEILLVGEGVVLLLNLAFAPAALFGLVALSGGGRSGIAFNGRSCAPGIGDRCAPLGGSGVGSGIVVAGLFSLQLGGAFVAAPALVDLLVRVAVAGSARESGPGGIRGLRLASGAVPVKACATAATTAIAAVAAVTASASPSTATAFTVDWMRVSQR